jgi:L-fuculose-phosphate aldolase
MADVIDNLKEKILRAHKIMFYEDVVLSHGHISARIPGRDEFLMIGHIHQGYDKLTPNHIIRLNFDCEILDGKELGAHEEAVIHSEIFRRRPDVKSVVHTHAFYAQTLSLTDQPLVPMFMHSLVFSEGVPRVDYSFLIATKKEAIEVAEALKDYWAVLCRGHGSVNVGRSVEEACVVAVVLERTAKMILMARACGEIKPLAENGGSKNFARGKISKHAVESFWGCYEDKYCA